MFQVCRFRQARISDTARVPRVPPQQSYFDTKKTIRLQRRCIQTASRRSMQSESAFSTLSIWDVSKHYLKAIIDDYAVSWTTANICSVERTFSTPLQCGKQQITVDYGTSLIIILATNIAVLSEANSVLYLMIKTCNQWIKIHWSSWQRAILHCEIEGFSEFHQVVE